MTKYQVPRSELHSMEFVDITTPMVGVYIAKEVNKEIQYWKEQIQELYIELTAHKGNE